jgi:hypothetical protein
MAHSEVDDWPLPSNIRLDWKGLPGTNTLAYYEHLCITEEKSFITLAQGQSIETQACLWVKCYPGCQPAPNPICLQIVIIS